MILRNITLRRCLDLGDRGFGRVEGSGGRSGEKLSLCLLEALNGAICCREKVDLKRKEGELSKGREQRKHCMPYCMFRHGSRSRWW
jgi:hypothetical protein